MSHQDTGGHTAFVPHHQALQQALDWLLVSARFDGITFRKECTWTPKGLVFTALLWAWSDEKTLTDRFVLARRVILAMAVLPGVPATTYQAFLKMLQTWTVTLTILLIAAFRDRLRTDLAARLRVYGFGVFGVDGSRLELPRTVSNERGFAPAKARRRTASPPRRRAQTRAARDRRARQKMIHNPQMWLTTMFHVGTGLPWDWRLGPSDSSERDHLQQMIAALPADALVTADAGFAGYAYGKALLDSGRHLLVRVGANVRLLRGLGSARETGGVVYLWPDREAARNQPPLVLCLVVAHNGRHPVYLVTSVVAPKRLSDQQVAAIYALRWGVELFYRHVKQTFARRKLRSQAADNASLEATWSLLGLWAMCLHTQVELTPAGIPARRLSVAKLLRAHRRSLREYKSPPDPGESLRDLLQIAVIDPYRRAHKASRDYPRKKPGHAIGAPEIRAATKDQINAARRFRDQFVLGLTA
jgi:hypothetical protein